MASKRGIRKIPLVLPRQGSVPLFTSAGVEATIKRLMDDATLFEGTKLLQAFEAIYIQGRKDGARAAFEQIESGFTQAKQLVPYKNPGRTKALPKPQPQSSPKTKAPRKTKRRKVRRAT